MWDDLLNQLYPLLAPLLLVAVFKLGPPPFRTVSRYLTERVPVFARGSEQLKAMVNVARQRVPLTVALVFFVPPALFFGWHFWHEVDPGASSTAAIGYVFVPIGAALTALPFALMGLSLGSLVYWRKHQNLHAMKLGLVGGLISIVVIAIGTNYQFRQDDRRARVLQAYARLQTMDDAGLQAFMRDDPMGQDRILLGVIAMHPASSMATLAQIAALPGPDLHERYAEYK